MELDERKIKILNAIIQTYLETGEPVGSRTISRFTDLKLSSATIRNEMSDLEEMGYILQPHTSAGRIPSLPSIIDAITSSCSVQPFHQDLPAQQAVPYRMNQTVQSVYQ